MNEYRAAHKKALEERIKAIDRGDQAASDLQFEVIKACDHRMAMVQNSHSARVALERWTQKAAKLTGDQHVAPERIKEIVERARTVAPKQFTGSMNPVFEVRDAKGNRYIFKHLGENNDVEGEIAVELAGAALAKELGIPAPAVTRVKLGTIRNVQFEQVKMVNGNPVIVNGKPVMETITKDIDGDGILMHFIEGEELWKSRESVVQAMNDQLARIRVFRAWLGDADGHLRNLRLGADGRLWAMDFGMGNLRDNGAIRNIPGSAFNSPDEQLEYIYRFAELVCKRPDGRRLYGWVVRYDMTTQMSDVAPLIDSIEKLCAGKGERLRELLKGLIPESQIDETINVLQKRGNALKKATEKYLNMVDPEKLTCSPSPAGKRSRTAWNAQVLALAA